jgi:hypothetical protein
MLDGLNDSSGDVPFAHARPADQDGVVGVVEEVAAIKLLHERLLDLAGYVVGAGRRVEDADGQVTLKTFIDGRPVSVKTKLPASEKHRAALLSSTSVTEELEVTVLLFLFLVWCNHNARN